MDLYHFSWPQHLVQRLTHVMYKISITSKDDRAQMQNGLISQKGKWKDGVDGWPAETLKLAEWEVTSKCAWSRRCSLPTTLALSNFHVRTNHLGDVIKRQILIQEVRDGPKNLH